MSKHKVTVTFTHCILDSQEYGSDDQHMVSRVFCDIETEGQRQSTHVNVKQIVGSDYETGVLEVGLPDSYRGPLKYHHIRDEVEAYYRSLIGRASKGGIRLSGVGRIRMSNINLVKEHKFDMEVDDSWAGW